MGVTLNFLPRSQPQTTPTSGNLRWLRNDLGLTQEALANRVGLCRSTISRIERHPEAMSVQHARKIAAGSDRNLTVEDREFKFLSARTTELVRNFNGLDTRHQDIVLEAARMLRAGCPIPEVYDYVYRETGIRVAAA